MTFYTKVQLCRKIIIECEIHSRDLFDTASKIDRLEFT